MEDEGDQITFLTSQRLEDNLIAMAHLFFCQMKGTFFLPNKREARIIEESVPKGQWKNWKTFFGQMYKFVCFDTFCLSWYITSFQCA
jgi:hypothetical protein